MRSVSDKWLDGISQSHQLALEVKVLPADADPFILDTVTAGTVTLDAGASVRGRLDLTVMDEDGVLLPTEPQDLLTPYGNEIQVKRGLIYPDGDEELVSLGIFRIENVTIEDAVEGQEIRITGLDRSARIIDARFENPFNVANGTVVSTLIKDVVESVFPGLQTEFAASSATTPTLHAEDQDDRWEFAQRAAISIGMELYFDGDGILVLRPVPSAQVDPAVAELVEGVDGVLLSAGREWTREGTFNKVIATGEVVDTNVPISRGEAIDDDPFSPTFFYGPFGQVPRFYVSQFISSDDQATAAAFAILESELGTTQKINFGSVVNPALEPADVVRVRRERAGIDEKHVIDSLTIPLSADAEMVGATRSTVVSA